MDDQECDRVSAYEEDKSTTPRRLCRHDDGEERVFWPISGVVCPPEDDYGHRVCCFVGDEEAVAKHLVVTEGIEITHHKPGWIYFQGKPTDIVRKEWAVVKGIRTFQDNIIVECVHSANEDELEATDVTFELGDWVTPDLGAYHGDVGCIVAIHDWGYDVAFIPWYFSHSLDHPARSPLLITTRVEAHTLSLPGQAGAKPLIEDGLQILELSAQTLTIARQIRLDILQVLMQGCIHTDSQKPNSLQALVSKSLWKCPRPQDWIFSAGEPVLAQSSIWGHIVVEHLTGLDVYSPSVGKPRLIGFLEVHKEFQVGDFVKILAGEYRGQIGCVQYTDDPLVLDVLLWPAHTMEVDVWRNSVSSTRTPELFTALPPDKVSDTMYTGKTPWQGANVIVLPSNDLNVTTAHNYKGQVGTVLDVLLKQLGPSGIRVCIRLLQTYRAAGGFADVWLDYDEVVEENTGLPLQYCLPLLGDKIVFMPSQGYWRGGNEQKNIEHGKALAQEIAERLRSATPPHAGSSKDLGTGNAWDPSAPEPIIPHWCRHPALAQQELHVNMLGKNQPQKVRMELTGSGCKMIHLFRTVAEEVFTPWMTVKPVEPNVRDFHRWVVIQGPGLGKLVRGIRYVEGSKPTKWWVREIDEFVGEPLEVVSSDMCVAADGNEDYQKNLSWAQSQRESPVRAPKRRRKDAPMR
ncbi:hypothetical protein IW261DRAFT_1511682 [Armillaria novae-zelandiae]|uniref:Uncharacterized protein n=1 Tax=Armillaria novae-zelandiae TaxID=153914 RepID=A0AA39NTB0_9AGAR|nr:hypothetical protein IW261DRAFT_1511682 [Armillaria novae-zelandiae]